MDLCDDVDTNLARTIPRICATNKFDAQIHGNVRRCGAGFMLFEDTGVGIIVYCISAVSSKRIDKRDRPG